MQKQEPMEHNEAAAIIDEVFGKQYLAAEALQRTPATINRWYSGVTPVRSMEARMLRLLLGLHRAGVDWKPLLEKRGLSETDELI